MPRLIRATPRPATIDALNRRACTYGSLSREGRIALLNDLLDDSRLWPVVRVQLTYLLAVERGEPKRTAQERSGISARGVKAVEAARACGSILYIHGHRGPAGLFDLGEQGQASQRISIALSPEEHTRLHLAIERLEGQLDAALVEQARVKAEAEADTALGQWTRERRIGKASKRVLRVRAHLFRLLRLQWLAAHKLSRLVEHESRPDVTLEAHRSQGGLAYVQTQYSLQGFAAVVMGRTRYAMTPEEVELSRAQRAARRNKATEAKRKKRSAIEEAWSVAVTSRARGRLGNDKLRQRAKSCTEPEEKKFLLWLAEPSYAAENQRSQRRYFPCLWGARSGWRNKFTLEADGVHFAWVYGVDGPYRARAWNILVDAALSAMEDDESLAITEWKSDSMRVRILWLQRLVVSVSALAGWSIDGASARNLFRHTSSEALRRRVAAHDDISSESLGLPLGLDTPLGVDVMELHHSVPFAASHGLKGEREVQHRFALFRDEPESPTADQARHHERLRKARLEEETGRRVSAQPHLPSQAQGEPTAGGGSLRLSSRLPPKKQVSIAFPEGTPKAIVPLNTSEADPRKERRGRACPPKPDLTKQIEELERRAQAITSTPGGWL